jgi:hypothetical protein
MRTDQLKASLAALVITHLVVAVVHGVAHSGAHVPLTPAALAFVILVIQLGPVVGLVLTRIQPRGGAAVVAASMAGALLFGVINHFVLPGSDHVSQVDAGWRVLFGSTAALLALIEAGGTIVGAVAVRQYARRLS